MIPRTCTHPDGCDKPADARGLCKSHYITHRNRRVACGTWTTNYTDAAETQDWINHLRGTGIGLRRIAELTGVPRVTLYHLANGDRRRVTHRVAAAVLDLRPACGHHLAAASALVDATGSRRRIRALAAIGYPSRTQCAMLGLSDGNLSAVFTGARTHIFAAKARQIEALYDRLCMTPGPSARSRRTAAAKGWAVPLAWDEDTIDDPDAQPAQDNPRRGGFVDRYTELLDIGVHTHQLAQRLGITSRSLIRQLNRHHIPIPVGLNSLVYEERYASAAAS